MSRIASVAADPGEHRERDRDWDDTAEARRGSSFYELPRVLHGLSGNTGYHHVHHFGPRVPNFHLERCHRSARIFEESSRSSCSAASSRYGSISGTSNGPVRAR